MRAEATPEEVIGLTRSRPLRLLAASSIRDSFSRTLRVVLVLIISSCGSCEQAEWKSEVLLAASGEVLADESLLPTGQTVLGVKLETTVCTGGQVSFRAFITGGPEITGEALLKTSVSCEEPDGCSSGAVCGFVFFVLPLEEGEIEIEFEILDTSENPAVSLDTITRTFTVPTEGSLPTLALAQTFAELRVGMAPLHIEIEPDGEAELPDPEHWKITQSEPCLTFLPIRVAVDRSAATLVAIPTSAGSTEITIGAEGFQLATTEVEVFTIRALTLIVDQGPIADVPGSTESFELTGRVLIDARIDLPAVGATITVTTTAGTDSTSTGSDGTFSISAPLEETDTLVKLVADELERGNEEGDPVVVLPGDFLPGVHHLLVRVDPEAPPAPPAFLPGDCNDDHNVTAIDGQIALKHVGELEEISPSSFVACDVTADGVLDEEDIAAVFEIAAGVRASTELDNADHEEFMELFEIVPGQAWANVSTGAFDENLDADGELGDPEDLRFELIYGELPAGLALEDDGQIHGTTSFPVTKVAVIKVTREIEFEDPELLGFLTVKMIIHL